LRRFVIAPPPLLLELPLSPVPLLCAQEPDANAIVARTIAIIEIHFAIFIVLFEQAVLPPRTRDSTLQE
jgi:hypothetical protein